MNTCIKWVQQENVAVLWNDGSENVKDFNDHESGFKLSTPIPDSHQIDQSQKVRIDTLMLTFM